MGIVERVCSTLDAMKAVTLYMQKHNGQDRRPDKDGSPLDRLLKKAIAEGFFVG